MKGRFKKFMRLMEAAPSAGITPGAMQGPAGANAKSQEIETKKAATEAQKAIQKAQQAMKKPLNATQASAINDEMKKAQNTLTNLSTLDAVNKTQKMLDELPQAGKVAGVGPKPPQAPGMPKPPGVPAI